MYTSGADPGLKQRGGDGVAPKIVEFVDAHRRIFIFGLSAPAKGVCKRYNAPIPLVDPPLYFN